MLRLVLAVFATIALVVFVMMNTHHVTLSVVVGGPVRVRMIFLLATTFLMGMAATWLTQLVLRARARRRPPPAPAPPSASPSDGHWEKP